MGPGAPQALPLGHGRQRLTHIVPRGESGPARPMGPGRRLLADRSRSSTSRSPDGGSTQIRTPVGETSLSCILQVSKLDCELQPKTTE